MYINYEDLKKYLLEYVRSLDEFITKDPEALHAASTLLLFSTRIEEQIKLGNIKSQEEA